MNTIIENDTNIISDNNESTVRWHETTCLSNNV